MKVLMLSTDNSILDQRSAAARRMIKYGELAESLKIIVLSIRHSERSEESHSGFFGLRPQNDNLAVNLSAKVTVWPTNSRSKLRALFDAYRLGTKIVQKNDLVITAQNPFEVGLVGYLLAKKLGAGLELQVHGDFFGSLWWQWHPVFNFLRYHLGVRLIRRARSLRAVSQRVKNSLRFLGVPEEKITVAPIFVPRQTANPDAVARLRGLWGRRRVVLGVGRLEPEKNFFLLIQAFAKAARQERDVILVIVGDGSEKNKLTTLAARLGLLDRVYFETGVTDVASYYATASVFVVSSYFEGWGRVVIEAWQAGCPVVMTDAGLAGEVLKDRENGLVVPVGDKARLAAAIFEILRDSALAERLVKKSQLVLTRLPGEFETLNLIKESWEKSSSLRAKRSNPDEIASSLRSSQ